MIQHMFTVALAAVAFAVPAIAQDRITVRSLLNDGYQIVHSEISTSFLQFLLKKDGNIYWCTVLVQNARTSICRVLDEER